MNAPETILIIGDSVSLGVTELVGDRIAATVSPTYVDHLRRLLPQTSFIVDAEIHRKTAEALERVAPLIETHRPDRVLLEVGGNDADVDWRRFIASRGRVARPRVPVETFKQNLHRLAETITHLGASPILTDISSHCLAIRGPSLSKLVGADITPWLHAAGGDAESFRGLQQFWAAVDEVARRRNLPVARFGKLLHQHPQQDQILGPDGVHPGADAHRLIARAFLAALTNSDQELDGALAAS